MKIKRLSKNNLEEILEVEKRAFIPSIQTREKITRKRLDKNHIYLGVEVNDKLVGTLALRFAYFIPDFRDFCKRNPTFFEYAEKDNEKNANAVFVYSIGMIPQFRNGINSKGLLQEAFNIANEEKMRFLVGDARVPSYNGSRELEYERFEKNDRLHNAVDEYLQTGTLPPIELIKQDPVAGFYLKVFPEGKVLGITDDKFWRKDEPCGGHMVIEYLKLK